MDDKQKEEGKKELTRQIYNAHTEKEYNDLLKAIEKFKKEVGI